MMDIAAKDELIDMLLQAKDTQLDACIMPRLERMKGREPSDIKDELLGVIDDCVFAALASGFVMQVLHVLLERCGYTKEDIRQRNIQMVEASDLEKEEFRKKFQWQCVAY